MRAGDMDRRVTLQRQTATDVWTDIATVWAKVEQTSGREVLVRGKSLISAQSFELTSIFRIRYRADVEASDWILSDDNRRHQIHFVRELGRKEGLELHTVVNRPYSVNY